MNLKSVEPYQCRTLAKRLVDVDFHIVRTAQLDHQNLKHLPLKFLVEGDGLLPKLSHALFAIFLGEAEQVTML